MVVRLDFYVGERDLFGIGFSDNIVFRKQYHLRALLEPQLAVFLHTNKEFMARRDDPKRHPDGWPMPQASGGWEFQVEGTGFAATLRVELEAVPMVGRPAPLISTPGL
jgi:hypothetical protein